jgi:hypothetical protein
MYSAIRKRKSVRDAYLDNLLKLGGVNRGEHRQPHQQTPCHDLASPQAVLLNQHQKNVLPSAIRALLAP